MEKARVSARTRVLRNRYLFEKNERLCALAATAYKTKQIAFEEEKRINYQICETYGMSIHASLQRGSLRLSSGSQVPPLTLIVEGYRLPLTIGMTFLFKARRQQKLH